MNSVIVLGQSDPGRRTPAPAQRPLDGEFFLKLHLRWRPCPSHGALRSPVHVRSRTAPMQHAVPHRPRCSLRSAPGSLPFIAGSPIARPCFSAWSRFSSLAASPRLLQRSLNRSAAQRTPAFDQNADIAHTRECPRGASENPRDIAPGCSGSFQAHQRPPTATQNPPHACNQNATRGPVSPATHPPQSPHCTGIARDPPIAVRPLRGRGIRLARQRWPH